MASDITQPGINPAGRSIPPVAELNIVPVVNEAQRIAAQTSVSGRKAVSRGTMLLAFYLWLLSGAIILSFIAQRTQFFPGDMKITKALQKRRNPWLRRFLIGISEIGFPKLATPLTFTIAGIFWALRFRLEALFILLTSSSHILNALVKTSDQTAAPQQKAGHGRTGHQQTEFPQRPCHVLHKLLWPAHLPAGDQLAFRQAEKRAHRHMHGPARLHRSRAHLPGGPLAERRYGGLYLGRSLVWRPDDPVPAHQGLDPSPPGEDTRGDEAPAAAWIRTYIREMTTTTKMPERK
jgi:hypothetical protein